MELFVILGIVVVVAGWYYFGKDTRKAAVNDAAQKSIAAVDVAAKKSLSTVDEVAKKSFSTVDGVAKKSVTQATKFSANVAQTSRGLFNRIKSGRGTVQSYLEWAKGEPFTERAAAFSAAGAAPEFKTWLASLSEENLKSLNQLINDFCADNNFAFSWLQNSALEENDPELKQALEEAVVLFSLASWKASRVQKDVEAMMIYESWVEEPVKGRNLNLSQSLFARMVDDRKVKASPELLLAPEKERREFVANTVKDFAERDRKAFNTMFKSVIAEASLPLAEVSDEAPLPAAEPVEQESKPAQKRVSRRTSEAA